VGLLVRCAGNGGNLLLNTGPTPQGTIVESHAQRYREMGAWLHKYGESIYATRGGPYTPGPWGCATRSKDGNTVYLHILGQWNGSLTLPDLDAKVVGSRCLTDGTAIVRQADGKLSVTTSEQHAFDTIVVLELDRPAMELAVVESIGDNLTLDAVATASSEGVSRKEERALAKNVVATSATDFDQGAFVRAVWSPERADKAPWLQIALDGTKTVSQIEIREGKVGQSSTVRAFTISARNGKGWEVIYRGDGIGNTFGLVLDQPVRTDALRLDFQGFDRYVVLNSVNAY
jgi:alpha-L-fucosidase